MYLKAELGDGAPAASAFMKDGADASYVGDANVSTSKEGTYILKVKSGGKVRPELLIVRDTKAPTTDTTEAQITIDDKSLEPETALGEIKDASKVTATWEKEPTYGAAGAYDCSIKLEDACGNSRSVKLTVKVLGLVDVLEHEAGQPRPSLKDFMAVEREDAKLVTDLNDITWDKLGDYEVKAEFDGKTFTSTLRIVDTTAPDPDIVPAAVLVGGKIEAKDLALSGGDATAVSYEFTSEPVLSKAGTVSCGIKATDEAGNSSEKTGKIIVCDAIAELEASMDMVTESDVLRGTRQRLCRIQDGKRAVRAHRSRRTRDGFRKRRREDQRRRCDKGHRCPHCRGHRLPVQHRLLLRADKVCDQCCGYVQGHGKIRKRARLER